MTPLIEETPPGKPLGVKRLSGAKDAANTSSSSGNSSNSSACTSCDDGSAAVSICKDCNEFMCCRCTSAHGRVKFTKDHNVVLMGQGVGVRGEGGKEGDSGGGASPQELPSPTSADKGQLARLGARFACAAHEAMKLYCETCGESFCAECGPAGEAHQGHTTLFMHEAAVNARQAAEKMACKHA